MIHDDDDVDNDDDDDDVNLSLQVTSTSTAQYDHQHYTEYRLYSILYRSGYITIIITILCSELGLFKNHFFFLKIFKSKSFFFN